MQSLPSSSIKDLSTSTITEKDNQIAWDLGPYKPNDGFKILEVAPRTMCHLIDDILSVHKMNSRKLLSDIDKNLVSVGESLWTLLLFEQELPLALHLIQMRRNISDYRGVSYTYGSKSRDNIDIPGLGGVAIFNKDSLKPSSTGDELMNCIWESISGLSTDHRWCVIARTPSQEWQEWIMENTKCNPEAYRSKWCGYFYNMKFTWTSDPGLRALANVHGPSLSVDQKWSMTKERGFLWWPHTLRQFVDAFPGFIDHGVEVFKIRAVTDFVKEARASPADVLRALDDLFPKLSGSSAPVYDSRDGSVQLVTICYVNESNENWIMRDFGAFAAFQIADAEQNVEEFAKLVQGKPARSAHPLNGCRNNPDEILNAKAMCMSPHRGLPNDWFRPSNLLPVIDILRKDIVIPVNQKKDGFSIPLYFDGERIAKLSVTSRLHSELGEGCWLELELPYVDLCEEIARIATNLTWDEIKECSHSHLAGAWTVEKLSDTGKAKLLFRTFLPNVLFRQGKLINWILGVDGKAKWVGEVLQSKYKYSNENEKPSINDEEFEAVDRKSEMTKQPLSNRLENESYSIELKIDTSFALKKGIIFKPENPDSERVIWSKKTNS